MSPPSGTVLILVHVRTLIYRDDAFGRWWTVSQSAVRSGSAIVTAPPLDQDLDLAQAVEYLTIQKVRLLPGSQSQSNLPRGPEPCVEALAVAVLPR